jgi:hypothetical protein
MSKKHHDEEPVPPPADAPAKSSLWGFNLSSYLWLPGINGSVSAGQHNGSVDVSFIDIFNKSSRVPLGFMGTPFPTNINLRHRLPG